MRINAHCHVFNLQSVFTHETKNILRMRLHRANLTEPAADFLLDLLAYFLDRPGEGFESDAVLSPLARWAKLDAATVLFSDILRFARVGFASSIDMVTDYLLKEEDAADSPARDDYVVVPLMMDILSDAPSIAELQLFHRQIADTVRQTLRHPGRVLPFYAINPARLNFVQLMQSHLDAGEFVGVKLYPSLGYTLDAPGMEEVFAYCNRRDVPLLMHCNMGGFAKNAASPLYCQPKLWEEILTRFPNLRICFGHFGGDENLTRKTIDKKTYTGQILQLMDTPAFSGRVFADISYHSEPFGHVAKHRKYFANLHAIMANPNYGPHVLWGTDYFLILARLSEQNYWKFYEDNINPTCFRAMSDANPGRFLGLRQGDLAPRTNIVRHREHLEKHGRTPPSWL